jgi:hypothetical protein
VLGAIVLQSLSIESGGGFGHFLVAAGFIDDMICMDYVDEQQA